MPRAPLRAALRLSPVSHPAHLSQNLMRDPRWGRAQEVPGECPFLTAEYAAEIIAAAQNFTLEPRGGGGGGVNHRRLAVALTAKHFSMYDMEGYSKFCS